ncbi:hypothetical protein C8R43DRAFT_1123891 [Mycena crocata]|nr:hypothetical protein C8R43DRAFT_1123891 [Mycena crocata]
MSEPIFSDTERRAPGLWLDVRTDIRDYSLPVDSEFKVIPWDPTPEAPPPPQGYYSDGSNEGYNTDESDDGPPQLVSQADMDYMITAHQQHFPEPALVSSRTQERVQAYLDNPAYDNVAGFRFMREPPGEATSTACKCYCTCSYCQCNDAEPIERAWASGIPPPPHVNFITTRLGFRRPLGPCPDDSHPMYAVREELDWGLTVPSAKQMAPGTRHDLLDDTLNAWNRHKGEFLQEMQWIGDGEGGGEGQDKGKMRDIGEYMLGILE